MVQDERDRYIDEVKKHTTTAVERLEEQFKQGMNPSKKRRETQKHRRPKRATPKTLKKNQRGRELYAQVNTPPWNFSTNPSSATPGTGKRKPLKPSLMSPLPLKFFGQLHSPKAKNKVSHLLTTPGGGRRKKRTKRKNRRKKKKRTRRKKRK